MLRRAYRASLEHPDVDLEWKHVESCSILPQRFPPIWSSSSRTTLASRRIIAVGNQGAVGAAKHMGVGRAHVDGAATQGRRHCLIPSRAR